MQYAARTMKAIRIHEPGGPDVLRLETVDDVQPGPGQIAIRVRAAGVNFIDVYHRSGLYPQPLPFTPGLEAAGEVIALGEGVTDLKRRLGKAADEPRTFKYRKMTD